MPQKTVLLVFLHGFKGGESTFGEGYSFTRVLRDIVAAELPDVDVKVQVYPQYETRGALGECVGRFREWLQNKVIDLEVAAGTPSPTVSPSVHVILVGHSMGGIVAAETVIALVSERAILSTGPDASDSDPTTGASSDTSAPLNSQPFPYVQGILAFDTPFLGLSPGIVAHGAEEKYMTGRAMAGRVSELWNATSGVRSMIPAIGGAAGNANNAAANVAAAATAAAAATTTTNRWGAWGKVALAAGGAAVVAASAGAAWYNRENISSGFSWVGSHLEFVGVLGKPEELRKRVAFMARLQQENGVGFVNMYTQLGAAVGKVNFASLLYSPERTFCVLPTGKAASGTWRMVKNDKAGDEITAHMSMFEAEANPGYDDLVEGATDFIAGMVKETEWYKEAGRAKIKGARKSH